MSVSLKQQSKEGVSVTHADVVVVGAGPYGLSVAAHLLAKGLKVAVFGRPLSLWRENMPEGMLLRSYWWATNLSDPHKQYSFDRYCAVHNLETPDPLPIEMFVDYGLWFQQNCVPNVDETYVASIENKQNHFEVTLEDGRIIHSQKVVMAPGLQYFVYCPSLYAQLSPEVVSHASIHRAFERFAGKKVAIVGGGQYALEASALLSEQGAQVDVIARHPIHWLTSEDVNDRSLYQRIRYPKAGIAPGWFNWGLENIPYGFQQLPRGVKNRLMRGRGRYGPAGAEWLKSRVIGTVGLHEAVTVEAAEEIAQQAILHLSDSTTLTVDHVILATGYRVNIWKLPMLHNTLVSRLRTYQDAPVLNGHFESNVPGLYFVGISSVSSFGPFYRFVVGVDATARRISKAISEQVIPVK